MLNSVIRTDLPYPNTAPQLYELSSYQIHRHSKTRRKYKNEKCRFHFGRFFTSKAITDVPLPDDLPLYIKSKIMQNRKCILEMVQRYIDKDLNPCKNDFFDNTRNNFKELVSIDSRLESLEINKYDFVQAPSISEDDSLQIHFKKEPYSCFANNYFSDEFLAWEVNMVIQPLFNQCKTVAYICAYL